MICALQTLTGPWPEALCMLAMFADVLLFSATMTYAATIAILKAFFLVYFKNVWALKVRLVQSRQLTNSSKVSTSQDDFWILFFKVWIGFMGAYSLVPLVTLPGEYPTYFVICIGGGQSGNNQVMYELSKWWYLFCHRLELAGEAQHAVLEALAADLQRAGLLPDDDLCRRLPLRLQECCARQQP